MSTPPPPPPPVPPAGDLPPLPPSSEGLQFDQAEFDHGTATAATTQCTSCKQPIAETYFEANGNVLCPSCKDSLHATFTGGDGSGGRFGRALLFGVPAALLSAAGYYLVQKITGYNLAIATIAMGWFVGTAVRRGSAYRGGAVYQALAVVLTYFAISGAYSVEVLGEPATLLFALVAAPIILGINSPISLLIYGFGLFQAWQLNRRPLISVSGPYKLGGAPADPAA